MNIKTKLNTQEEYISIEELIKQAKRKNVDFGKGDSYNRLRYYTKIGWIPHMRRMKNKKGKIKGHYPATTIDRLILIQKLKSEGMSNSEVSKKLSNTDSVQSVFKTIKNPEIRNKALTYVIIVLLFIILSSEFGIINIGESKAQIIYQNNNQQIQIIDAGSAFVPKDRNEIFVNNSKVNENTKVYISFKEDYSPASKFWVADIISQEGFMVKLDAPVLESSEFDWWVSF